MGNREDLLAGAVRCLTEKGWSRTTVRDIAAAAGVSHAAIGYHFGSREALLLHAYIQAMADWGDELNRAMSQSAEAGASQAERDEAMWEALFRAVAEHRQLWLASVEALVQAEHNPELRELLAAGQREGHRGLAAGRRGVPEDELDEQAVRSVGAVQSALITGLMVQRLLDPERAPTGAQVVAGLRELASRLTE